MPIDQLTWIRPPLASVGLRSGVALAVLAAFAAAPAQAQQRPWYVGAGLELRHESNVHRLYDGQDSLLPSGTAKADNLLIGSLTAGYARTLGVHNLQAGAGLRAMQYQRNDRLNSVNPNAFIRWGVDLPDRWHVDLDASAQRRQVQLANVLVNAPELTQRNLENSGIVDLRIAKGVVTRWTARGGYTLRKVDYSSPAFAPYQHKSDTVSAGLDYQPHDRFRSGLGVRVGREHHPDAINAAGQAGLTFNRKDIDWDTRWLPAGRTVLESRLSLTRTSQGSGQDWSGWTGRLRGQWQFTGKSRASLLLQRDTATDSSFRDLDAGVVLLRDTTRLTDRFEGRFDHQATAKIGLYATLGVADRRWHSGMGLAGNNTLINEGSDRVSYASLGGSWAPTLSSQVRCSVGLERRDSKTSLGRMSSNTVGCGVDIRTL